jgi:hypothetical protein
MIRTCPGCRKELPAFSVRCSCGVELPETRDRRSVPDQPRCNVCGNDLALMTETCPSCGADGYPALRSRKSKKSLGSEETI